MTRTGAWIATAAFACAIALAWSGALDTVAHDRTRAAFERALVTFAAARTLNGVISVAQGTEVSVQPAGVGVVLTPGEILDPLNDLIEQFSWLVLIAASSLGVQLLLGEILATPGANAVLTGVVAASALLLWWRPPGDRLRAALLRLAGAVLLLRFAIAAAALCSGLLSEHFLAAREAESVEYLRTTSADIERRTETQPQDPAGSTIERLERLYDESRETLADALDVRARLSELQRRADAAIRHVVDLIVVYTVETLLLPLGVLLLGYWAFTRLTGGSR
jgi:uncharacterized membrane protein